MIASLMMYRRAELEASIDRYWALIRDHLATAGLESPEYLSQDIEEFSVWKDPSLVLSQTCGMPYRKWLHNDVELIGTPDFDLEECPPGYYRSPIVVRRDDARENLGDFKNGVFAYNQEFSQSGFAAPFWHVTPYGFWFEKVLHTGQHLGSARAVADGAADIASLDAVSWRLMQEYDGFAKGLRVLEWTKPTPGLPYIAAKGSDVDATYNAVAGATRALADIDREKLGIRNVVKISSEDYLAVPNP